MAAITSTPIHKLEVIARSSESERFQRIEEVADHGMQEVLKMMLRDAGCDINSIIENEFVHIWE